MASSRVVAVFARYPEPGRVKTRLAAAIGDDRAAALYAAFVEDLARRLVDPRWTTRWWVAPPDPGFARRFAIDPAHCREQSGADLGARMYAAFASAHREGCERCVLVGSDMPHLEIDVVAEAFERLAEADVVLGPAEDGGYYLIAMRQPENVFDGVAWSTQDVFAQTVERARSRGLRVSVLAPGFDVDDVDGLERLRAHLRGTEAAGALPHTAAALESLAR
jgi:rSAM/selenodomain-associated transferase 1